MITINNDGQAIKNTDYWDTDHAKRGFVYVTWNAGAMRILLPPFFRDAIPDIKVARKVTVAPRTQNGIECILIEFDDDSEEPFALVVDRRMCDREFVCNGPSFPVTAWTRAGKIGEWHGTFSQPAM